jgi:hypothetical protein
MGASTCVLHSPRPLHASEYLQQRHVLDLNAYTTLAPLGQTRTLTLIRPPTSPPPCDLLFLTPPHHIPPPPPYPYHSNKRQTLESKTYSHEDRIRCCVVSRKIGSSVQDHVCFRTEGVHGRPAPTRVKATDAGQKDQYSGGYCDESVLRKHDVPMTRFAEDQGCEVCEEGTTEYETGDGKDEDVATVDANRRRVPENHRADD